ncbi:MAG: hypothetical protein JRJ02_01725 [Deltaproteobacteria bacterium]|nr:hypothetical protein [Deltaproteobacteria bacterium]MBW1861077.1 hypothetical protein [Deltaproteobacteria bacterium]
MEACAVTNRPVKRKSEPIKQVDEYYSVEFFPKNGCSYQFKIYNNESTSLCILVKENSDVLNLLKAGDIFNMKYYSNGSNFSTDYVKTAIRHIYKHNQGRFKGHFLVGLEILKN